MKRLFFMVLGLGLFFCAMTSAAQAQATRTWVSGLGDDANPCSRTAPCKTFAGAYSKTAAGGEIDVIDPGGFGTVTISKSLTIDGGGGLMASILGAGTTGIRIFAGATDEVTIRNLTIQGVSQYTPQPGLGGIQFNSGRNLVVEHCVLENFTQIGLDFEPMTASDLEVFDTTIMNSGTVGVFISTIANTGGVNRATLRNVRVFSGGGNGIQVGANSRVSLYSVTSSRNGIGGGGGDGVLADGSNTDVSVDDGLFSNNGTDGIHARNTANIYVFNTTVQDNANIGTQPEGTGHIYSGLNNRVKNNGGGDGSFTGLIPLS